jgi:hypothetical protein
VKNRVLFVLKYREAPYENNGYSWGDSDGMGKPLHSGLYNSARMVMQMLNDQGIADAKLVHVPDNNKIHKEIVEFQATHVVIEAFWVVPEKFEELHRVCPDVKFYIRNHSELPFLSNEGMAFDWIIRYVLTPNVYISSNAPRATGEIRKLLEHAYPGTAGVRTLTPYLPNYYPLPEHIYRPSTWHRSKVLNVGCFGAVRPLKNHIVQAAAAIKAAEKLKKNLRFHINAGRVEMNGSPILKNLRQLFEKFPSHELIEVPWMVHDDFKAYIRQNIDLVAQCNFSETFNIVSADALSIGVPIVTSKEIAWSSELSRADPNSSTDIADVMVRVLWIKKNFPYFNLGVSGLKKYNQDSICHWKNVFGS